VREGFWKPTAYKYHNETMTTIARRETRQQDTVHCPLSDRFSTEEFRIAISANTEVRFTDTA
jgi:hypothetical protein